MTFRQCDDPTRRPEKGQNRPPDGLRPGFEGRAVSGAASARSRAVSAVPDSGALLHLVDRAARQVLLPGEAQALRTSVEQLQQLATLPVRNRGNLREVLLGWVEAVAPDVSVREVELLVQELTTASASGLAWPCPLCRAQSWVWCRSLRGDRRPWRLHTGRRRLAGELS